MASAPEIFAGSSQKVAFFAVVEKPRLGTVGANQILVFEKVITNVGDAYNAAHGLFIAPVKGLYLFSASVMADNNKEIWTMFTHNNKDICRIYARGTDERHAQGSQTMILQLEKETVKRFLFPDWAQNMDVLPDWAHSIIVLPNWDTGDIVCVQNKNETKIYGETYTTFAGYLIG